LAQALTRRHWELAMKVRLRSLILLTLASVTWWSCEPLIVGPSLSDVVIDNIGKAPTVASNPGLCCCRVTGTVRNRNAVPLYLTITFSAFAVDGRKLSSSIYFIPDIAPGSSLPIDAPGFLFPCDGIGRFTWEVKARGLTNPAL
jgi:hypothetical protein